MNRLTDDELKALKAGATPGPWRLGADMMTVCTDYREPDGSASPENFLRGGWVKSLLKVFPSKWISASEAVANGNLSAAAPDLLDEVMELRAKVRAADAVVEAGQDILDRAVSTYTARNNRQVSIEADDGEKCLIVHSDAIHGMSHAMKAYRATGAA